MELREQGKSYRQIEKALGCSKSTVSYHLSEGQKEKTASRKVKYRTIIHKFIQNYKETNPCTDCGDCFPYYVMDFDHIGDKEFAISRFHNLTNSFEKVKEEMAKCELVCANCHRVRTFKRIQEKKAEKK